MRRRTIGTGLLLAAFVFATPNLVLAQNKKDKDAAKNRPSVVDSAKLKSGEYVGTLKEVPGEDRTFIVELESLSAVPSGVSAATRTRPAMLKYKTNTIKTPVEFQATEKVKVRTMVLPELFDDKGNPKKYSASKLAELRGKDKLVGYESALDKLEAGQKVSVLLAVAPAKPATKDKDKDEDAKAAKKMQVKMIVILSGGSGDTTSTPAPKKKDK